MMESVSQAICAQPPQTARAVQFGAYSNKLNCAARLGTQTERQTAQNACSEPSPKDTRNSCALDAPQHVRVSPKAAEGGEGKQHPISSHSEAGYAAFQGRPARAVAAKAKNPLAGVTGGFVAEGV